VHEILVEKSDVIEHFTAVTAICSRIHPHRSRVFADGAIPGATYPKGVRECGGDSFGETPLFPGNDLPYAAYIGRAVLDRVGHQLAHGIRCVHRMGAHDENGTTV
jgi:hypothetical protein